MASSSVEIALQNELILKKILDSCSIKTLQRARLVCSTWYTLSLSTWREKTRCVDIEKLLLASENVFCQFSRYPTDSFCCNGRGSTIEEDGFWLPTLINMKQNAIKHLEIRNYKFRSISAMKPILFCRLPNLETLKLEAITVETENAGQDLLTDNDVVVHENLHTLFLGVEDVFGILFRYDLLLRSMPGLRHLHVNSYEREPTNNFFGTLLREISDARRQNPALFRLETLDWIMSNQWALNDMPFEIMDYVATYGAEIIALKTLSIDIGSYTRENLDDSFGDIIEKVASTIQHLDVYCRSHFLGGFEPQSFFASQLDNLVSLRITHCVFSDMSFLKYLPKLETLYITNDANNTNIYITGLIEDTDLASTQMDSFCSKRLKVLCFGYVCGINEIASFIQWMPCLRKIFLIIGEKTVWDRICENFKTLNELTILPLCTLKIKCDKLRGVNVRIVNDLHQFNVNSTKKSIFHQLIKKTE